MVVVVEVMVAVDFSSPMLSQMFQFVVSQFRAEECGGVPYVVVSQVIRLLLLRVTASNVRSCAKASVTIKC